MSNRSRPDILRWLPTKWGLFLGNYRITKYFKKLVRQLRRDIDAGRAPDLNRLCFLLTGQSRSGKTALVRFLARCLTCVKLDPETLNPCDGSCWACRQQPDLFGLKGLETILRPGDELEKERTEVHLDIIDCTKIYTPQELRNKVQELGNDILFQGIVVVYLDEVHRLVSRRMDELLLKAIEEMPFLWILSTAKPGPLEDMLKNRLLKFNTEIPSVEEMDRWIVDRCTEWEMNWEPAAVVRVVEKSNRIVGTALHALALASLEPEGGLTLDLVENDWCIQVDEDR